MRISVAEAFTILITLSFAQLVPGCIPSSSPISFIDLLSATSVFGKGLESILKFPRSALAAFADKFLLAHKTEMKFPANGPWTRPMVL